MGKGDVMKSFEELEERILSKLKPKPVRGRAVNDLDCAWCGYPFDAGDSVWLASWDALEVFCSKDCYYRH